MQHQHCAQMLEAGPPVHDGAAEQHVYALVGEGEAPPVHLLPTADHTLALLEATSSPLHFWRCNATAGASMPGTFLSDYYISHPLSPPPKFHPGLKAKGKGSYLCV